MSGVVSSGTGLSVDQRYAFPGTGASNFPVASRTDGGTPLSHAEAGDTRQAHSQSSFMGNTIGGGFEGQGSSSPSPGVGWLSRLRNLLSPKSDYQEIPSSGDEVEDPPNWENPQRSMSLFSSLRSVWSPGAGFGHRALAPVPDSDEEHAGPMEDLHWDPEDCMNEEMYSFGDFMELSWETRILCFLACFLLGSLCSIISSSYVPLIAIQPAHFALFFSVGNILSLCSTGFLIGPPMQLKTMLNPIRRGSTIVYLGSICFTLYVAVSLRSTSLTLFGICVQTLAYLYYSLSYIPYGRATAHKLASWLFGCLTCQKQLSCFCP